MSSNPSERGINRRHLIRTGISAATVGLSPLLSACLVNAEDKARIDARSKDPPAAPTAGKDTQKAVKTQEAIALNPQDLYKVLLTTPIAPADLPKGIEPKGNQAGNLDQTAKAFNAIGQVNLLFTSYSDPRLAGQPTGALSYTIFPETTGAKGAFDTVKTQTPASKTLPGFDSPAILSTLESFGGKTYLCTTLFDKVFVAGLLGENPFLTPTERTAEDIENRTILFTKAGINHLKKVGNPKK